jgi:ABC-type transporter MlaC component
MLSQPVAWKDVIRRGSTRGKIDGDKPKLESYPKDTCKKLDKQDKHSDKPEYKKVVTSRLIRGIKQPEITAITVHGKNIQTATKSVRASFNKLYGKLYVMDKIVKSTFIHRFSQADISVYSFTVSFYKKPI